MTASLLRLRQLREQLEERELGALLVTGSANVRYLAGFTGTNGTLLVSADSAQLFTDFRYIEQAAEQAPDFSVVDGGAKPREVLAAAINSHAVVGFDAAEMRVAQHSALSELLDESTELKVASGIVERLREVKDADEIAAIERAAAIGDSIYAALAEGGLVGRTERELAWQIEVLAREGGASGLSFPPIVAAGAHGALPHAEPRDVKVEPDQLVVLDLGVVVDGYCSDCTRTFATGDLATKQKDGYELVLRAQQAALAAVVDGASCSEVDSVAREIIAGEGLGEAFGHSLGHGVGIEVHETPTLSARSEGTLSVGNVVTVEPGIYIAGEFGVRIEDLVVVEEAGPRVLTPFSKELTRVG